MELNKLREIIENHKHWLKEDCTGWEHMYADLRYADLRGADLRGAVLTGADLKYADLRNADLKYADLKYADLRNADLRGAVLTGADLKYADLRNADLTDADLRYADLRGADLTDADLRGADLRYADLIDAINIPFIPYTCPDTGSFIGYKKALDKIIKLEILEDAKRCSSTGRKCRCDKAKVLEIQNIDGTISELKEISSNYDENFIYKTGEIVEEKDFDENRWNECTTGIHFFINREEAVSYI